MDPLIGLLTPLQRDGARDFAVGAGRDLSVSKIRQALGVAQGELPWRTSFGAGLPRLRFQANTEVTAERARIMAVDALAVWAPSVTVTAVKATKAGASLLIQVTYIADAEERVATIAIPE